MWLIPFLDVLRSLSSVQLKKQLAGSRAFVFLPLVQVHFPAIDSDFYQVLESCGDLLGYNH